MAEHTDAALKLGIAARAIVEARKFLEDASHMIETARNEPLDLLTEDKLNEGARVFSNVFMDTKGDNRAATALRAAIEAMIRHA